MPVAVVTDSTAYLPAELVSAYDLTIVPLTVVLAGTSGLPESQVGTAETAKALASRKPALTTSRPAPGEFARAYRGLLERGADGVLSLHLSAGLSGTLTSAGLGAAEFGERVSVLDSGSIGMGLGFPVLAAAAAARAGADLTGVRRAALEAMGRTRTFFYVDSLEHLRRGGRINTASALLGTALSVKPILHVTEGGIALRDKVRTAARGLARLTDLAVQAAGDAPEVDVAVHHFDAAERAVELIDTLTVRLGERLRAHHVTEAGAVVATHTGPGLVCVVVHQRESYSNLPAWGD